MFLKHGLGGKRGENFQQCHGGGSEFFPTYSRPGEGGGAFFSPIDFAEPSLTLPPPAINNNSRSVNTGNRHLFTKILHLFADKVILTDMLPILQRGYTIALSMSSNSWHLHFRQFNVPDGSVDNKTYISGARSVLVMIQKSWV